MDIRELKKFTDEIIGEDELVKLLERSKSGEITLNHYIGFEISGRPHIGSGLQTMLIIKELQKFNVHCRIFLADWHSWINDKLGGDKEFIKNVGIPYFKENFIAAALCVGVDPKSLEFIEGSSLAADSAYWADVIDVSKNTSLSRIKRSVDIMGRSEGDSLDFAKMIYPAMQVADVFYMQNHIIHAGTDQRKAHVIAIDSALQMKFHPLILDEKKVKPIAIHHHLLMGLLKPSKEAMEAVEVNYNMWADMKMSKSKPASAVFLNDTPEEVKSKIMNAYCPEGEIKLNPIMDWAKFLCFTLGSKTIEIKRKEEWGGDKVYSTYEDLERDYVEKKLHPMDLKNAIVDSLIEILKPAVEHLKNPKIQKMAEEISSKVTR